jgi:hypothetical protein
VEHVVFFPAHDGTPAFRRVSTLDDAVRLVEHLRNVEGVNEVSCHALTEVPLAFRAYYRVEVPGATEGTVPVQPVAQESAPPMETVPAVADQATLDVPAVEVPSVEVPSVAEDSAEPTPEAAPAVEAATDEGPADQGPADEAEPAMSAAAPANGRATDGAKSLGFFA